MEFWILNSIGADKIILPAAALRDEGTALPLCPPGDEAMTTLTGRAGSYLVLNDIEHIAPSLDD